jgi:hypothetical protein
MNCQLGSNKCGKKKGKKIREEREKLRDKQEKVRESFETCKIETLGTLIKEESSEGRYKKGEEGWPH